MQTVFVEMCERVFLEEKAVALFCCRAPSCFALRETSSNFHNVTFSFECVCGLTFAFWHHLVYFPHNVCFLQLNSFLKRSCSPFAFPMREITAAYSLVMTCTGCYFIRIIFFLPLYTDCSSECLTSPKGLPLVLCRLQGIAITAWKARLLEPTQRGRRQKILQTHHTNKWPSRSSIANRKRRESRRSLPLAFQRTWYFAPCSTPYLPYRSHSSLFKICVLLSANTWHERTRKPLNQTEVPPSHGRWNDAHTDNSTLFVLRLSRSCLSLQEVRRHANLHSFGVYCEGSVWVRESVSPCNVQLSACESQTHCVSSVPIKSVL